MRLCECGCQREITATNPKTRFIPGHHTIWLVKQGTPHRKRYVPKPEEIPSGLCECGCGKRTTVYPIDGKTQQRKRHFPGHPVPFLVGHSKQPRGAANRAWKGGRLFNRQGYVLAYAPEHPRANKGYVLEHRLVMERVIGRELELDEDVHHKNHDRADNRAENLEIISHAEHTAHHAAERKRLGIRRRGSPRRGCKHRPRNHTAVIAPLASKS